MLLNASETIGTLSGGASGAVAIGANTLTVNQASNGTLGGAISGSGSLVKNGGGALVLSGVSGFSGATQLNSGELVLSAGGADGSLGFSAITVESGTTLRLATGDASGYAASGVITVRGTIEKGLGDFHDTLNRNIILDGGTLSATDGSSTSGGAYNLFGNTVTTVTGTTSNINVSGTTLQIRLDGATSPDFNVVAGSQLNVNAVVDGFLGTETAALNKSGGGTMVLLQNNLYDGVTNINGGTLQVGNGGAAGTLGAGAVNNSGALVIDRSGSYDVTKAIGGTGSVELAGDATVTFSGVSNYTGDTLVSSGTLLLTGQLGDTDVTVDAGATIGGDGSLGGSLHFGAGSNLIFSSTTTLTVNGSDVTFDGFGVANLIGLDGSTPDGTYVLIDGAATVKIGRAHV
jgi:autotransporter-associated beta strand protein